MMTATASDPFADLDTFDTERVLPKAELVHAGTVDANTAHDALEGRVFVELCGKCRGTGIYYGRSQHGTKCFPCKGVGKFTYRTSREDRIKAKSQRDAAKVRKAATGWEAFSEANPAAAAWIVDRAPRFDFAAQMRAAVEKCGHLTDGQLAAVERLRIKDAERDAQRAAEKVEREASAPVVDITKVVEAIRAAQGAGIKAPKLRLAGFRFSPAPAHGANAGAIYVKTASGDYLGKIAAGKFYRGRDCNQEQAAEIVAVAADPEAAAIAYGRKFGSCACCGRELSDPVSVARGIGPVCAGRFGWGA